MIIRQANKGDLETVIQLTKELATYEKQADIFHAEQQFFLDNILNDNPLMRCYLIEDEAQNIVGMGSTYFTLSTYRSQYEMNLQDFYIKESFRHKKYGKKFLQFIAQIAKDRNCSAIYWACLDWNELAMGLYNKVANSYDDVVLYSMDSHAIDKILSIKH